MSRCTTVFCFIILGYFHIFLLSFDFFILKYKFIFFVQRESVLTRLLKDSLDGTGQTVMVACVTPARSSLGQTLTTLRYAQQATHIRPRPLPPPPSTIKVRNGFVISITWSGALLESHDRQYYPDSKLF